MNEVKKEPSAAMAKFQSALSRAKRLREVMETRYQDRAPEEIETEEERFNRIMDTPGAWKG